MLDLWLTLAAHAVGVALVVFPGGWIVGHTLLSLRLVVGEPEGPGLYGAGRVIGRLERFLIYLSVISNTHSLIAVVIGAKTIVRFPELTRREDNKSPGEDRPASFAEYYLVGTLLSLAIGLLVPLLVQWLLRIANIQPPGVD